MSYQEISLSKPVNIDRIVSIHYFEYTKNFAFSGEMHDFWEVVYADHNALIITAGAKEITLRPGEFYIHRPMEFHNIRCAPNTAANSVIFSFYCSCEKLYTIAGKVLTCAENQKMHLAGIIREAKNVFSTPLGDPYTTRLVRKETAPFGAEQLIASHIELFLIECLRENTDRPFSSSPLHYTSDPLLSEICHYLEKSVTENITFSKICAEFSISDSKLKRLFREKIGCGAMDYFHQCKIDCAKHLIREQEKNLTQIADYLGYNSLPYFSRQFKSITGMTPTQYADSVQDYNTYKK